MRLNKIIDLLLLPIKVLYSPSLRRMVREDWDIRMMGRTNYYSALARERSASCGKELRVNFPCTFGGEVHFGNNCNFNGISVLGGGG